MSILFFNQQFKNKKRHLVVDILRQIYIHYINCLKHIHFYDIELDAFSYLIKIFSFSTVPITILETNIYYHYYVSMPLMYFIHNILDKV